MIEIRVFYQKSSEHTIDGNSDKISGRRDMFLHLTH